MSRYLYSYLLKIIICSILSLIFIPSLIYFICSFLLDKNLNVPSLLLIVVCIMLWIITMIIIIILNKKSNNKVIFEEGMIKYKGKTMYTDCINMKYFKFHISVIEPSLVIPMLYINGNNLSLTCYLSKKDIKKLESLNFEIKKI